MKATLRARFTQHKALHDKISIASARRHVQEGNHGNIELNVNRLTATLFSNLRARLQQSTTSYKCNQGHGWIEHNM